MATAVEPSNRHGIFEARCSLRRGFATMLLGACYLAGGCHSGPQPIVSCPIPANEQQEAVLKIAPLRTEREEAIRRLEKAGIDVSPGGARTGQAPSIYYCNVWQREDGSRWQMDVALLFDASGKLYATRASQAETVIDRGPSSAPAPGTAEAAANGVPNASPQTADSTADEVRGSGPRVPFTKER